MVRELHVVSSVACDAVLVLCVDMVWLYHAFDFCGCGVMMCVGEV